jgi:hypothetical protein
LIQGRVIPPVFDVVERNLKVNDWDAFGDGYFTQTLAPMKLSYAMTSVLPPEEFGEEK